MALYLTSSPTGAYRGEKSTFEGLDPSNGLLEELYKDWKKNSRCLLICADPKAYEQNDQMGEFLEDRLLKSDLDICSFTVCDYRNVESVMHNLSEYDFIILGGGHVPTQNQFFEFIHLRHLLHQFKGSLMGISARKYELCRRSICATGIGRGDNRSALPQIYGRPGTYQYSCDTSLSGDSG